MTAPPPIQSSSPKRPGLVTAITVMTLVNGILNILFTGILALVLIPTLIGWFCLPLALYPLVLGILEVVYAARLLSSAPPAVKPATYLSVMEICAILVLNVVSLVVGILTIVFYGDPSVKAYFRQPTSISPPTS